MTIPTTTSALAAALPEGAVVTDPDILESYRRDSAPATLPAGQPAALVHAASTADVVAVLRWANAERVPVVPRGAGSGLSGGANAVDGCVVLSLARMDRIVAIEPADQYAVVQPGVINADLARAAAEHGLCYPPDPASRAFSTLGGNLATNAGGLCCVKYGVTGDFVLGLEVVLADGEVLRTGRKTVKGVAGYDLSSLFVGSEGTLGVITEATLRLRPAALGSATLAAFFPTLRSAGDAVAAITRAYVVPSLLEVMDRTTIRVVDDELRMGLDRDAAALLLAQSDVGGVAAEAEIAAIAAACEGAGASYVATTTDRAEGEALLAARRAAYPALERLGTTLLDDVCVPRSKVPDLIAAIERAAEAWGVLVGTFGHAGDGNMHPTIVYDAATEADRAWGAFDDIVAAALDLGGTVTGEHGVGVLKRTHLAREIGATGTRVHQAVKQALDPLNLLNPGKVL